MEGSQLKRGGGRETKKEEMEGGQLKRGCGREREKKKEWPKGDNWRGMEGRQKRGNGRGTTRERGKKGNGRGTTEKRGLRKTKNREWKGDKEWK